MQSFRLTEKLLSISLKYEVRIRHVQSPEIRSRRGVKDSWDISGGWTCQTENVANIMHSCKVIQRDSNQGSKVIAVAPLDLSWQISTSKPPPQSNFSLICFTH